LTALGFDDRIQELEGQVHSERMQKEEAEGLVTQAETALIRVRKAKDSAEAGRETLVQEVEDMRKEIKELSRRNEELEAETFRSKNLIEELTRQKARLSKLCGLCPMSKSSKASSTARSPTARSFMIVANSSRGQSTKSSSPKQRGVSPRIENQASSPPPGQGLIGDTSFSPLITQDVLSGFPSSDSQSPVTTCQGSVTIFSAPPMKSESVQGRKTSSCLEAAREYTPVKSPTATTRSPTVPVSQEFGRHSAERMQRHKDRKAAASEQSVNGGTPWKQERRLTEMARKNQLLRSNIEEQAKGNKAKDKDKLSLRRSFDDSKRRFNRAQFIMDQAGTVPAFVGEALRKQMVNKNGVLLDKESEKENIAECVSPEPAAVEISMEATKANVSLTASAMKSLHRRRATISGTPSAKYANSPLRGI
jgi:hypothetical protein